MPRLTKARGVRRPEWEFARNRAWHGLQAAIAELRAAEELPATGVRVCNALAALRQVLEGVSLLFYRVR